jgi:hypothetical protein
MVSNIEVEFIEAAFQFNDMIEFGLKEKKGKKRVLLFKVEKWLGRRIIDEIRIQKWIDADVVRLPDSELEDIPYYNEETSLLSIVITFIDSTVAVMMPSHLSKKGETSHLLEFPPYSMVCAIRQDKPIYVSEKVMAEYGISELVYDAMVTQRLMKFRGTDKNIH